MNTRALLLAIAVVAVASTACLPTLRADPSFNDCKITYFDARVRSGQPSPLKPYLDEVTSFTGMRFVRSPKMAGANLVIRRLVGRGQIAGFTRVTGERPGPRGRRMIVATRIDLRPGASAGVIRHELGHLFNLGHDPRSRLMQPVPYPNATYSEAERYVMRAMAQRSTCRRTVSFG